MKRIEFSLKEVEKMLLKDWTVKKIAEYYGCSRNSVSNFLKQNDLISNKRKKVEENKKICSYEKLYEIKDDIGFFFKRKYDIFKEC